MFANGYPFQIDQVCDAVDSFLIICVWHKHRDHFVILFVTGVTVTFFLFWFQNVIQ